MSVSSALPKSILLDEPTPAHYSEDHERIFNVIYSDSLKGESLEDVLFVYEHPHELLPGVYLHRKKQKTYRVICLVISPSTSKIYVLYQALYHSQEFGENSFWVRELDNFTEPVSDVYSSGKPRFEYLGP